jgi:hypothetical protein
MKKILYSLCALLLLQAASGQDKPKMPATPAADSAKAKKPLSIAEKIKSSTKLPGLFTLYQDTATGSLQMYIRKDQLAKEFIYQSFSISGPTALFLNQSMHRSTFIFKIKKAWDKLEFNIQNTAFYYDSLNAVSRAANVDVTEAVFYNDKITAEDSSGYLILADAMFLSEKLDPVRQLPPMGMPPSAYFSLGSLNPLKSKYEKIRSYPDNTDVVVDLAYDNPMPYNGGGADITDARYNRIKIQHSFLEIPVNEFRPRYDDPRIGYFTSEVNDLTALSYTPYKDVITRWNLVKKNPNAALSEPVTPITFWVENTTPVEYREIVKEAGEKWNEAFEQAGFKNAVVMKIMPDTATWDPADIRYNVIRWVSSATPAYGAIGPSFINPRTGQILGSDITVEWATGAGITRAFDDLFNGTGAMSGAAPAAMPWEAGATKEATATPYFHFDNRHLATCNMAKEMQTQYATGLAAIETLDDDQPDPAKKAAMVGLMHRQFLYYLVLHEMGHTLGLNHNMKATQMLRPDQLNDTTITHKLGLQGSVMDYPAINVSSDRSKQGDYYTTKPGPYDLWAIEYGYRPFFAADEAGGLEGILKRSTNPQLAFGNDADDMRTPGNGIDPRVMINDMSSDAVAFAEDRLKLVNTMMPKLKARFSKPNQSYAELRSRWNQLNGQRNQQLTAVSRYIGGVYVDRSFAGQETKNKPFTPVPVAYQKKAIEVLSKYAFAPHAFDADSSLFPYLQMQRRGYNFFGNPEDVKPQRTFMNLQAGILGELLHPTTLERISSSSLYGNTYSIANTLMDLNKAIFDEDMRTNVNLYRQNLQGMYVRGLASIVNSPGTYDNASKAAALAALRKIRTVLVAAVSPDEQTKAHRASLIFTIDKALKVD